MRPPGLIPGRFWFQLATSASAAPVASIAGFGPAGAATFVLLLEPGAKVTYSWMTEVLTSYSGVEQRISYQALPAVRIDGSAFLLDGDSRADRARLMRSAASGATFLLALPYEERIVDAVDSVLVAIDDTSTCDWAQVGQRIVLLDGDGNSGAAVIQATTATQLELDAIPAGVTALGARVMPAIPVVLEPQQGFTRFPVRVDYWDLRARSVAYGWCGIDVIPAADVLTFDAGLVAASELTDDSLIIWDRPNLIDGTAAETLASRADLVDLGGLPFEIGGADVPDWIRPIKLRSTAIEDFQWIKAFARNLRGAQGMFLLPTGRDDLPYISTPAYGQIKVAADFDAWFSSLAHKRLAITTTSGIVQYIAATSVTDNGDGTNTILLSGGALGPIDKISLLEQVRLENDDVAIVWDGGVFTCDLTGHVVQDTTATEDIVTSAFSGHGLDGDIVFPPGTYSMARDMYWRTGEMSNGTVIATNGFVPHFQVALIGPPTGTGIIQSNGADASGSGGASGYGGIGTLHMSSGTGGSGASGAGGAALDDDNGNWWPASARPGVGGNGGAGTSSGGAGSVGPANGTLTEADGSIDVVAALRMLLPVSGAIIAGGASGGGGGGNGTQSGGGGGAGAGNLVVCAGQFIRPETIVLQAKGGKGGNGQGTNCGGGGGGGGGLIVAISGSLPFPSAMDNGGGVGGASGGGTGHAGSAGASGAPPLTFLG